MKVSVLINNYNYGRYLTECIESIINQSYHNIEIIIYDDGSTDDSIAIANKYKDKIAILAHPNYGKKPAFNQANAIYKGFQASSGEIICLIDSDDFFTVDKVTKVVKAFQDNPHAVLVQNGAYTYTDGKITGEHDYAYYGENYQSHYYRKKWTAFFNPTSCLSFRRSYLTNILPINEDNLWRVWPDVRLSRIAPFYGEIAVLNDKLTYYRRHRSSDSVAMNKLAWNALRNQRDHHIYVNQILSKIGEKTIYYKSSWSFMKYIVKGLVFSIYPKKAL
jgi:glycosyltransferase involved in cell wall biosynthesis